MRPTVVLLALLLAGCASRGGSPPATFVPTSVDASTTQLIDVRDGLSRTSAMRTLTDVLAQHFTVDVVDARAGFVMTAWDASLMHEGVPDLRYRTRFVARFLGDNWRKLQLHQDANWANGEGWDVGYDAAQMETISNELRAKLGAH